MADVSSLGNVVTDVGSAVGQLFGSEGNAAEANSFSGAATLAEQNAQLTAASTRIQETQTARQLYQTEGTQQADVASAGFTESGSALDLLKSTMSQGSLAKSLVNIQGSISENSYAAQAGAYEGEAAKANEASDAGLVSAIGSIGGALVSGGSTLASAGKTVASGISTVAGWLSSPTEIATPGLADATQFTNGVSDLTDVANETQLLQPGVVPSSLLSAGDTSIAQGANLGDAFAASNIGIDTSGVAIGESADAVGTAAEAGISDVADAIASGVSDFASGAVQLGSEAFDAISNVGDLAFGPAGLALAALSFVPGFSETESTVQNASFDFISGIADDIGLGGVFDSVTSFFGSVICTALYNRGMLSRRVWNSAQKYGRDIAPENVYAAYLLWGRPIAKAINKSKVFASVVAPIFVPWAHELAVLAGEKSAKSTVFGRAVFRITYGFSWALGTIILLLRRSRDVEA